MPAKDLHAEPFDEGTVAKLDIFERYLREWLPVFIQAERDTEVNIVDFFAGSGSDPSGKPGSPLRIVKVLREFAGSIIQKRLKVKLTVNEKAKRKFDSLCQSIQNENTYGISEIRKENRAFRDLFDEIKTSIKNTANLIFIDQNGIKEVNDKIFLEICSFGRTDFLFFISSSYALRFQNQKEFQAHLSWMGPNPFAGAQAKDVHRIIAGQYRKLIDGKMEIYLIPFTIKKSRNIYGLIFCSKHILAAEKFLTILWKMNEQNGEANFDIDNDAEKAQQHLWENEQPLTKLDSFEKELEQLILSKEQTNNREIYIFTINNGFLPKHAKEALKKLRDAQKIEKFSYAYIGYKQAYKGQNPITFRRKLGNGNIKN